MGFFCRAGLIAFYVSLFLYFSLSFYFSFSSYSQFQICLSHSVLNHLRSLFSSLFFFFFFVSLIPILWIKGFLESIVDQTTAAATSFSIFLLPFHFSFQPCEWWYFAFDLSLCLLSQDVRWVGMRCFISFNFDFSPPLVTIELDGAP